MHIIIVSWHNFVYLSSYVIYIFYSIKGDSPFCLSNIVLWLLNLVLARQDDMKTSEVPTFMYIKKIPKGLKWQILWVCLVSAQ